MAVEIKGELQPGYAEILSKDALAFLEGLHKKFEPRRRELVAAREKFQKDLDAGKARLDFPAETKSIREDDWQGAPIPTARW